MEPTAIKIRICIYWCWLRWHELRVPSHSGDFYSNNTDSFTRGHVLLETQGWKALNLHTVNKLNSTMPKQTYLATATCSVQRQMKRIVHNADARIAVHSNEDVDGGTYLRGGSSVVAERLKVCFPPISVFCTAPAASTSPASRGSWLTFLQPRRKFRSRYYVIGGRKPL